VDLNDSPEQAEYRSKVRAWLEAHRQDAPSKSGNLEDGYLDARKRW